MHYKLHILNLQTTNEDFVLGYNFYKFYMCTFKYVIYAITSCVVCLCIVVVYVCVGITC